MAKKKRGNFQLWNVAKTREMAILEELKIHRTICDCGLRGRLPCLHKRRILAALLTTQANVLKHSGPFGNPNITRYG
jgi:hypothetical protein